MRFVLYLLLGLLLSCNSRIAPKVNLGVLDLRNWDLEKDGSVELVGDWEFYFENFFIASDFTDRKSQMQGELNSKEQLPKPTPFYMKTPSVWKGIEVNGKRLPGHGYATYRMKILLGENQKKKISLKD